MSLEPLIRSEVSQTHKNIILTSIWNLKRGYWWTYFQGSNRDTDIEQTCGHSEGSRGWDRWEEEYWNTYITLCKKTAWGNLLWDAVGGRFEREGTYVYLWSIHVDVWQKPTQHCKAFIFQLKINFKNAFNNIPYYRHFPWSVTHLFQSHKSVNTSTLTCAF